MNNALKYIEILSIEQVEDKYYLQIALHTNQVTEVYWQIDEVTYENLYLQCVFTGRDRYRLSFKILENPLINKLVGRITRTYLTSSTMIDFQTTKDFKQQLQLIRSHCQTNSLYQLEFIQQNIHGLYAGEEVVEDNVAENIVQEATANSLDSMEITSDEHGEQLSDKVEEAPIESNSTDEEQSIEEASIEETEKEDDSVDKPQEEDEEADSDEQTVQAPADNTELVEEEEPEANLDHTETTESTVDLKSVEETETGLEQELLSSSVNNEEEASEQPQIAVESEEDFAIAAEQNQNQATTLVKLIEESNQAIADEEAHLNVKDSEQEQENENIAEPTQNPLASMNLLPNQTVDTPPANQHDLQPEAEPDEVIEETTVVEVKEVEEQPENHIEKINFAAEEEKNSEVPNIATDTAEPVELATELNEPPSTETLPLKEKEETHHISNNKIALLVMGVALIIAVAVYFSFFQNNTNTLNTEAAVINDTSNAATYKIEESFTFSLPNQYVALTFNRGPSVYTEEILRILQQYNYGATFFLQGNQISLYPDLVKTLDAKGHAIGHITNSHTLLTILEIEDQRYELINPKEEIQQLINRETLLFRPPFNTFNKNTISIQQEYNLKIINSSIALKSSNDITADKILQQFDKEKLDGAIIGLDESQSTIEALPKILEKIKNSNLQVVVFK